MQESAWGKDEGLQRIDKLVKASENVRVNISKARQQLEKTLEDYNDLLSGQSKDARKAYARIQKDIGQTEKLGKAVAKSLASMQKAADEFFVSWEENLQTLTNESLKARSQKRLEGTKKRFADILKALEAARELFEPFMAGLNEQVVFLGHDLTPGGIELLAEDAGELNEQAGKLFKSVNALIEKTDLYAGSISPS